jgi:hypothetical protein
VRAIKHQKREKSAKNLENWSNWIEQRKGTKNFSTHQIQLRYKLKEQERIEEEKAKQRLRDLKESLSKAKARYKEQIYDHEEHQLWIDTLKSIPKFRHLFENKKVQENPENYYEVLRILAEEESADSRIPKLGNTVKTMKKMGRKTIVEPKITTTFDEEAMLIAQQLANGPQYEKSVVHESKKYILSGSTDESMVNSSVDVDALNTTGNYSVNKSGTSTMEHENDEEGELDLESVKSNDQIIQNEFYNEEDMEITFEPNSKHLLKKQEGHTLQNMHERLKEKASVRENDKKSPWTVVGSKQMEREYQKTFEAVSKHYLPINLPNCECIENDEVGTKFEIPLSLTVKNPKVGKFGFKNSRILVAFLKALQMAYSDTYIAPINNEKIIPNLVDPMKIKIEDEHIKPYMLSPVINSNGEFTTKIIIRSNHELKEFKTNPGFRNYIGEAGIMIDNNRLETVEPVNVGFLENVLPSYETTTLHYARLLELLPARCPEFQVTLAKSGGKKKDWIQLVMIQCDKEDVFELATMLNDISDQGHINFFSWLEYTTMSYGRKITVNAELRKWNAAFRCLILEGFEEDNDIIPMQWRNEDDVVDNKNKNFWETTNVTQYLQNHVKNAKGENLFEFVYPQINGTREFLVYWENFGDAQSYMANAKGELARNMNIRSINAIFKDPHDAYEKSKRPAWRPFKRASTIAETVIMKPTYQSGNKRIRTSTDRQDFTTKVETKPLVKGNVWDNAGGGIIPSTIIVDENKLGDGTGIKNRAMVQNVTSTTITNHSTTTTPYTETVLKQIPGNNLGTTISINNEDEVNILKNKLLELEKTVTNMENKIVNIPNDSVRLLKEEMQSMSNESHRVLKNIITSELSNEIKSQNASNLSDLMAEMKLMMGDQTQTLRDDLCRNHKETSEKMRTELELIKVESTAQNDELYDMMALKLSKTSDKINKRVTMLEGNKKDINQRITRSRSLSRRITDDEIMTDDLEEIQIMEIEKELCGDHTVVLSKKNE